MFDSVTNNHGCGTGLQGSCRGAASAEAGRRQPASNTTKHQHQKGAAHQQIGLPPSSAPVNIARPTASRSPSPSAEKSSPNNILDFWFNKLFNRSKPSTPTSPRSDDGRTELPPPRSGSVSMHGLPHSDLDGATPDPPWWLQSASEKPPRASDASTNKSDESTTPAGSPEGTPVVAAMKRPTTVTVDGQLPGNDSEESLVELSLSQPRLPSNSVGTIGENTRDRDRVTPTTRPASAGSNPQNSARSSETGSPNRFTGEYETPVMKIRNAYGNVEYVAVEQQLTILQREGQERQRRLWLKRNNQRRHN